MGWTPPRTWVTGEVVTSAELNTHIRDNLGQVWHVVAYTEFTANVSVPSATDVVTAPPVTFDGAHECRVEFYAPSVTLAATANATLQLNLFQDGSDIGEILVVKSTSGGDIHGCRVERRFTPASGSRTFKIRATQANGTQTVNAGAGGGGNVMPGYIRVWQQG